MRGNELQAQGPISDERLLQLIKRLETNSDRFSNTIDAALDRTWMDGSMREDNVNALVQNLEKEADQLRDRMNNRSGERIAPADAEAVLRRAMLVDTFMFNHGMRLNDRARRDWARVRSNLDEFAAAYNLAWVWTIKASPTAALDADRLQRDLQNPQMERVGLSGAARTVGAAILAREVRHELLSDLPYYGVFDWIEFKVLPGSTVVLRGQVTSPPDTKSRAEAVVKDVDGVNRVINEIEVLPVSPNDDRLRRALYRAIYDFDSPLFRYGVGSRQSIHIIVKGGRATLKGAVDSDLDKQLAYTKARGVSGLFEVNNQLRVDSGRNIMPSCRLLTSYEGYFAGH